jgi:hypothetical protein
MLRSIWLRLTATARRSSSLWGTRSQPARGGWWLQERVQCSAHETKEDMQQKDASQDVTMMVVVLVAMMETCPA